MLADMINLFPYYINHLLIACVISLIFRTPVAGIFFYVGREITDLEKLHNWNMAGFDWPGFLWPVIPLLFVLMYMNFKKVVDFFQP